MLDSMRILLSANKLHLRRWQRLVLLLDLHRHGVRSEDNGVRLLGVGRLKLHLTALASRHGKERTRGNVRHLGVLTRLALQTLQPVQTVRGRGWGAEATAVTATLAAAAAAIGGQSLDLRWLQLTERLVQRLLNGRLLASVEVLLLLLTRRLVLLLNLLQLFGGEVGSGAA